MGWEWDVATDDNASGVVFFTTHRDIYASEAVAQKIVNDHIRKHFE
jgi:hypothetical protein